MRILGQPLAAVGIELGEPVFAGRAADPSDASVVQVGADRLASWPRWRAIAEIDQPPLTGMSVHIILRVSMKQGSLAGLLVVEDSSLEGAHPIY
jgi:hypothetical protein